MKEQTEISKAKEYWATVEGVWLSNDAIDDGSYYKESENFFDIFFTKGWNNDTPMNKMVKREGKEWVEFIALQTIYLESMGIIKVVYKGKEIANARNNR